ncbi:MAG: UDP-N-acetylglucosamine 2-epimerase [Rhodospirillaceae bacterium]|nr:UDP-N-acetylglucosamine 2-epimerase [Rhodospirillaceae bacterium]
MSRLLSVSSSRADVGILMPVWRALASKPDVELHLFLTGMHQAEGAPAVEGLPESVAVHRGGADLGGAEGRAAAGAMGAIATAAGDVIAATGPDAILVVGDRLDMLPAATASLPFNLPLAHLHGGEVTEGAVDNQIRHALSKLAHWHCVATDGARDRLIAMGEDSDRITVTGAPGLDTLLAASTLPKADFLQRVGLPDAQSFRLVTVHTETNASDTFAPVDAVLHALAARPGPTLFTAPNSDPGGLAVRRWIEQFCDAHDWAAFVDTLGIALYPSALQHATVMVGNSSSGVIEAGLFGLPAVNVGDRQKGRERGANVIDVPNDAARVESALDRLGSCPDRGPSVSPYGDGAAGPRVAEAFAALPGRPEILRKSATEAPGSGHG